MRGFCPEGGLWGCFVRRGFGPNGGFVCTPLPAAMISLVASMVFISYNDDDDDDCLQNKDNPIALLACSCAVTVDHDPKRINPIQ